LAKKTMIVRLGGDAGLSLGAEVLREANLNIGDYVEVEVIAGAILIRVRGQAGRPILESMIAACDRSAPMPPDLAGWS
jgi:antitoxin component of MazEF toxin-antitoxin module